MFKTFDKEKFSKHYDDEKKIEYPKDDLKEVKVRVKTNEIGEEMLLTSDGVVASDIKEDIFKKSWDIPLFLSKNKKNLIIGASILVLLVSSYFAIFYKNAQQVFINGDSVATIKGTDVDALFVKDQVLDYLTEKNGAEVFVNEDVTLENVRASNNEMIPLENAIDKISKQFTFKVEANVITIDGEEVAVVLNEEDAKNVLNKMTTKYANAKGQIKAPTFVQNVRVEKKHVSEDSILDINKAVKALNKTKQQGKIHTIKEGDTLFEIALNNNMSLEELLKMNTGLTEESRLKIGQEINLIVPTPLLSVKTYEKQINKEVIPKETVTIPNDKEYRTFRRVVSEGQDGVKEITSEVIKVDGQVQTSKVLSEKIIKNQVSEKVQVGTLKTPPKRAIGNFAYPVNGRLSSGFGSREGGEFHKGIDLAVPYKTPVKASDGGVVVEAGWHGGYGYMVEIDHGNGFKTLYGHNSSVNVSVGQRVAQGEVISYAGSTGNSTGNHVHFEVIKNGQRLNPNNYLR